MPEIVDIPVVDLLVDQRNARLEEEQASQQAAILAIAEQQGSQLIALAADIVDKGMTDPTALPAVVPTEDQLKRYLVLEGNRRVVALKALETPSLVSAAFGSSDQKRLNALAARFADDPIDTVTSVLFDREEEAMHWITLRHTGQNKGVGLVEWGAAEKDRWASRHGLRSPERQILDFVAKHGHLSPAAKQSKKGIITSLKRLIGTPDVREILGLDVEQGEVIAYYPTEEVAKSLTRVIEDLKSGDIRVKDIYYVNDRKQYAAALPESDLPSPKTKLDSPVLLDDLTKGTASPAPKKKTKRRRKTRQRPRTAVIPKDCHLDIRPPRINTIYNELLNLSVDQFPNACSVLVRVFLELTVDHYLDQESLMTAQARRDQSLAKRIKVVADYLQNSGMIEKPLHQAAYRIADSQFVTAASTVTFNQYVHNQYVFPKGTELRVAWDELQPLIERMWA